MEAWWAGVRERWGKHRTLWLVLLGVAALFVVAGIVGGEEGDDDDSPSSPAVAEPSPAPAREPSAAKSQPEPAQLEPSPQQLARDALGDSVSSDLAIGESEVRSVYRTGQLMNVILSVPEGGFEGPSTNDADTIASEAFAKVYGDAGWDGAAWVEFRGGRVSSATGQELPNAEAFTYRVESNEASRIDWSDEEALFAIGWSLYRAFCHPAFKGC